MNPRRSASSHNAQRAPTYLDLIPLGYSAAAPLHTTRSGHNVRPWLETPAKWPQRLFTQRAAGTLNRSHPLDPPFTRRSASSHNAQRALLGCLNVCLKISLPQRLFTQRAAGTIYCCNSCRWNSHCRSASSHNAQRAHQRGDLTGEAVVTPQRLFTQRAAGTGTATTAWNWPGPAAAPLHTTRSGHDGDGVHPGIQHQVAAAPLHTTRSGH